jgi:hypothetical protein
MVPKRRDQAEAHSLDLGWLIILGYFLSIMLIGCGISAQVATSPTATNPPVNTAIPSLTSAPTSLSSPSPTPLPSCVPTSTPTITPPSSSQSAIIPPKGWTTFTDSVYHYSIQYPANWIVPYGSCSGMAFDVYNFDPRVGDGGPEYPAGGFKIEVLPLPNPEGLSALDFSKQEAKKTDDSLPCPSYTTKPLKVAGRDAVATTCPAIPLIGYIYYVPDGVTMLSIGQTYPVNAQPDLVLTQMVASLTIANT